MSSFGLLQQFGVVASAPNGVQRLREMVLQLAVQGKLVPQDPTDEPASQLLERIAVEKERLIAEGKIKRQKPLPVITEEEKPFELPQGWEWVRLGEITEFVNGYAFQSKDFSSSGIGVIKIGDIQNGEISTQSMSYVHEHIVANLDDSLKVLEGELVIAMSGATTGKLGINRKKEIFYLNQRVGKIIPYIVPTSFLYHVLITKVAENLSQSVGSAIPNLSTVQIKNISFALPPQQEIPRILAKVDSLLTLCDQLEVLQSQKSTLQSSTWQEVLNAITNASSTLDLTTAWQRLEKHLALLVTEPEQVKGLRDTLLQLAVQGKLVPQDPNDEPASVLLAKIQAEKERLIKEGKIKRQKPLPPITEEEKPFELPKGWEWVRLQEVGDLGRGKSKHRPRNDPSLYTGGNIPFIQTGDVARAQDYIGMPSTFYNDKGLAQSKLWSKGTLCITIAANIADTGVLEIDACFPDSVVGFCPTLPELDIFYYKYFIQTAKAHLNKFAPSTAQKNINLEILDKLLIPQPPEQELNRIVTKVSVLMSLCDQLESRLQTARQTQAQFALETVNHLSTQ